MNLYKKAEKMLYDYPYLKIEVKNLELDIEELKSEFEGVRSISYDEKSGPTNKFNSDVENEIIIREKKISNLIKLKNSKERQILKINNILSILSEDEKKIIELRYFKNLHFKEISSVLANSEKNLMRKRKKVISDKIIPLMYRKGDNKGTI